MRNELRRFFGGDASPGSRASELREMFGKNSKWADAFAIDPALRPDIEKAWAGDQEAIQRLMDGWRSRASAADRSATEHVLQLLTPEQKLRWLAIVGEPFAGLAGSALPARSFLPPFGWGRR
jgi:hypothetical protein